MNRKILINFSKLKGGGGQNVALNFLNVLSADDIKNYGLQFRVVKNSTLDTFLKGINIPSRDIIYCSENALFALLQDVLFSIRGIRKRKIGVVYTYFGYSTLVFSRVPQICGSADSNIYYPEIQFWFQNKFFRFLVDKFREYGVRQASGVVFENPELQRRGRDLFSLTNTAYIKPSIADNVSETCEATIGDRVKRISEHETLKVLFLCGWQENKGFLIMPEVLKIAQDKGYPMEVVMTATPGEGGDLERKLLTDLNELGVAKSFKFEGVVPKDALPELFSSIHVICLLSRLESFSNNIIESWRYSIPLIISDIDWARAICSESAVYVDRDSPEDVFRGILSTRDACVVEQLLKNGTKELGEYPSARARLEQELEYVQSFL